LRNVREGYKDPITNSNPTAKPLPEYTPWRSLRSLLENSGVRPRKSLGQHFLTDARVLDDIQLSVLQSPPPAILEIGPGPGVLTERLLDCAPEVVCVEIDETMAGIVRERFKDRAGLTVLLRNAFENNKINPDIFGCFGIKPDEVERDGRIPAAYHLVANLPYNIGAPLLAEFMHLSDSACPARMIVMLQKEQAGRFIAKPGAPEYGPLAVSLAIYGTARIIRRISPASFWPRPNVNSAVLELKRDSSIRIHMPAVDRPKFIQFVRCIFQRRRQMLRRVLKAINVDEARVVSIFNELALTESTRFEELPPAVMLNIWRRILD
jgi:16S rRNA (adenine1518-N6/adenine1519-N6)-dimethyltransferase